MKAERNKTIDFLPEDAPEYLARCPRVTEDVPLDAVCGRTICGDTFQVAPHLPRGFADLLIARPAVQPDQGRFRRRLPAHDGRKLRRLYARMDRAAAAAAQAGRLGLRLLRLALEPGHRHDAQGLFPAAEPHHLAA